MNKQKLVKFKRNVKHYMPEILAGTIAVIGVASLVHTLKNLDSHELFVAIDREKADSILVLEQISMMAYRDLDTGEMFHVTPLID